MRVLGLFVASCAVFSIHGGSGDCDAELKKLQDDFKSAQQKVAAVQTLEKKVSELEAAKDALTDKLTSHQKDKGKILSDKQKLQKQLSMMEEKLNNKKDDSEVLELRMALKDATKSIADLQNTADDKVRELNSKLKNQKENFEQELKRAKMAASSGDRTLLSIATERFQIHASAVQARVAKLYQEQVLPRATEAYAVANTKVGPHFETAKATFLKNTESLHPHYAKVSPYIDELQSLASKNYATATKESKRLWSQFLVQFRSFRKRSIATLESQPQVAEFAEEIIDAVVVLIVVILVMLFVGPIFRFIFGTIRNIFYYGFCCCCCCSRRRSAAK